MLTTECSAAGSAPGLGPGCRRFESCRSEMQYVIYSLLSLFACTAGAISGMGGGVIVKPIMDLVGHYDAVTISLLSSITVYSMSIVSLVKSRGQSDLQDEPWSSTSHLVVLGVGGVIGGLTGQTIFSLVVQAVNSSTLVTLIQNILFFFVSVSISIFLLLLKRIRTLKCMSYQSYGLTGLCLGMISAFLGIGGGPINVAVLMFMFSFDMKTAAFSSILVIFFSQSSKLLQVFFSNGFSGIDLSIAPFMILFAIIGGFVGTVIKKKMTNDSIAILFNVIQVLIIAACIINIIKSASSI